MFFIDFLSGSLKNPDFGQDIFLYCWTFQAPSKGLVVFSYWEWSSATPGIRPFTWHPCRQLFILSITAVNKNIIYERVFSTKELGSRHFIFFSLTARFASPIINVSEHGLIKIKSTDRYIALYWITWVNLPTIRFWLINFKTHWCESAVSFKDFCTL